MAVTELSDGNPDGTQLGQDATTDKIGFWGTTPVVQPTSASQAAVTATATTAMSTTLTISASNGAGTWAFASSTVANALSKSVQEQQVDLAGVVVLLNQIRAELAEVGLITGS